MGDRPENYEASLRVIDRLTTELAVARAAVPSPLLEGVVLFHNRPDGILTLGIPGADDLKLDIGTGFALYPIDYGPLSEAEVVRVIEERDALAAEVERLRAGVAAGPQATPPKPDPKCDHSGHDCTHYPPGYDQPERPQTTPGQVLLDGWTCGATETENGWLVQIEGRGNFSQAMYDGTRVRVVAVPTDHEDPT